MTRLAELLLVLPVLALAFVRLRTGAMPGARLLFWTLMACLALGATLAWLGADRALHGTYIPARMQDGRVVPGHGAT